MKLFLTASTITPELIQPFEAFYGRSVVHLKAAFIPDAGLKTPGDKTWIDDEMQEVREALGWQLDKVTLADETPESLHRLRDYDVIYVNGGYSGYLAQMMHQSGFDVLLPELLAHGVVYVGSSAGSMVLSEVQDAASFYFPEPEPEALEIGGLGLVDFEFYPMHDHRWTEDLVDQIKARRNKSLPYYLVRDGQAVSVEDGRVMTYGEVIALPVENQ
jgi:dipeptidase E